MTNRVRIYDDRLLDFAAGEVEQIVDDALDAGSDMAHRLVPVDTGYLDSQIGVQESAHRDGDDVVGTYGVVGVDYAEVVEFGGGNSPEQPYLRPSIDACKTVLR